MPKLAGVMLVLASLLSACGGSDGDGLPCGGAATLNLTLTYAVNGQVVDPTRTVTLVRNLPVQAAPQVLGLPSACAGAATLTATARDPVPAGLTFDAATGVIGGTPTALASFGVDLKLEVAGYTNVIRRTVGFFM